MIEFHPCPSCGAEKIRTTVRVCSSCEISERYEGQIDELKAKCDRLEKKVDLTCREREEAKLQRDNLRMRLEELEAYVSELCAAAQMVIDHDPGDPTDDGGRDALVAVLNDWGESK